MAIASKGLSTYSWNTQIKSALLLLILPYVLMLMIWLSAVSAALYDPQATADFLKTDIKLPPSYVGLEAAKQYWGVAVGIAFLWYLVAFFFYQNILDGMTGSHPIQRTDYPDLYDALETLCISRGLTTPKICVIETDALNAYASGLSEKTYSITVTTGLLKHLNKEELEAVLAHEISHILNDDVFLSMIAVIFTGVFSMTFKLAETIAPERISIDYGGDGFLGGSQEHTLLEGREAKRTSAVAGMMFFPVFIIPFLVGWFISSSVKFAFSRQREYLADAGAVELTKNPTALIAALKKVAFNPTLEAPSGVACMCIVDFGKSLPGIFSSHPTIEDRIKELVLLGGVEGTADMESLYLSHILPTKETVQQKRDSLFYATHGHMPTAYNASKREDK